MFVATFLAVVGWGYELPKNRNFILVGTGVVAVLALFTIYFLSKKINQKWKKSVENKENNIKYIIFGIVFWESWQSSILVWKLRLNFRKNKSWDTKSLKASINPQIFYPTHLVWISQYHLQGVNVSSPTIQCVLKWYISMRIIVKSPQSVFAIYFIDSKYLGFGICKAQDE